MNENKCELRTGYVSDYDAKRHMARVIFPDKGNLVSNWLPVSVRNSLKNHDEHHLDINEHVACIMSGNGIEEGIVMSALYDNKNPPPESDSNIRKILFSDGTCITYDRNSCTEKHDYSDGAVIQYDGASHSEKHDYVDGTGISYNANSSEYKIILPGGEKLIINPNEILIQDHHGSFIKFHDGVIDIQAHKININEV